MAFNRALTMGVAFATRMGDTNSANKYAAA